MKGEKIALKNKRYLKASIPVSNRMRSVVQNDLEKLLR